MEKTAQIFLSISDHYNLMKFKFEDLNNSKKNIKKLLFFYNLDSSDEINNKYLSAPVVGSLYGISETNMNKPNWKPDFDKKKFVFSGKWKKRNFYQKLLFKFIAGKMLICPKYENDNKW